MRRRLFTGCWRSPQSRRMARTAEALQENQENPLEADVVIIDEMSMVDIYLMHSLLLAIVPGTRLIMVGDRNQLLRWDRAAF